MHFHDRSSVLTGGPVQRWCPSIGTRFRAQSGRRTDDVTRHIATCVTFRTATSAVSIQRRARHDSCTLHLIMKLSTLATLGLSIVFVACAANPPPTVEKTAGLPPADANGQYSMSWP